jgi:hypothetical protein
MSNNRVLTAPLCVIKVNGIAIGKMKDLRVTESIRRGKVVGLGSLVPDELPAIEWEGSMTCGFYTIDLKKSMIPGLINRTVTSIEQWTNTVLLQEDGVQIDIYKRVKDPKQPDSSFPNISTDPNFIQRVINGKLELFASVMGCFINREAFNISESSISGRDVEIQYLQPILYSPGS